MTDRSYYAHWDLGTLSVRMRVTVSVRCFTFTFPFFCQGTKHYLEFNRGMPLSSLCGKPVIHVDGIYWGKSNGEKHSVFWLIWLINYNTSQQFFFFFAFYFQFTWKVAYLYKWGKKSDIKASNTMKSQGNKNKGGNSWGEKIGHFYSFSASQNTLVVFTLWSSQYQSTLFLSHLFEWFVATWKVFIYVAFLWGLMIGVRAKNQNGF